MSGELGRVWGADQAPGKAPKHACYLPSSLAGFATTYLVDHEGLTDLDSYRATFALYGALAVALALVTLLLTDGTEAAAWRAAAEARRAQRQARRRDAEQGGGGQGGESVTEPLLAPAQQAVAEAAASSSSPAPAPAASFLGLSAKSRRTVVSLSALFAMDSFGGGLVTGSLIAYYFHERFGVDNTCVRGVLWSGGREGGRFAAGQERGAVGRPGRGCVVTCVAGNTWRHALRPQVPGWAAVCGQRHRRHLVAGGRVGGVQDRARQHHGGHHTIGCQCVHSQRAQEFCLRALGHVCSCVPRLSVRVQVVTHLPSNVLLALVPAMPTLELATAVLFLRYSISQMDVAPRQSYVSGARPSFGDQARQRSSASNTAGQRTGALLVDGNAGIVPAHERTATMGITNIVKSLGAALGPGVTGSVLCARRTLCVRGAAPLLMGGGAEQRPAQVPGVVWAVRLGLLPGRCRQGAL